MGTFTKKIKSLTLVILLFATGQLFAGAPSWTRVDYTNSTTFVGIVKIIQYTPTFGYTPVSGDYIGAFVGTECRMIAQIFANGSDLYVSSVIQGGENCAPNEPNCVAGTSEKVTFRLWSNAGNQEYASIKGDTLTWPGSNIGSTTPYEIGKGKTGKDLLSLTNAGTLSPTFSPTTYNYIATVSTIPTITSSNYTSSPNSTVTVSLATNLNGTVAERTTKITVTSESGSTNTYTIVYTASCTTPTITISPTLSSVCKGNSTTLTASGASSYLWSTGSSTASITITPTTNTTYTITGTSATGGCTGTATQTITVNSVPTVNAGTDISACINTNIAMNASITGGGAPYKYTWNPSTNLSNNSINAPMFTTSIAGATTYTLSVTDANGCFGSDVVIITANGIPTVTASTLQSTICIGATSTLTASGANSYTWSNVAKTSNITVTPTITTTYSVTGTDVNGCIGTANVSVKVYTLPTVLANATASAICTGSSTTISASGANSYVWSPASGIVSPTSNTTYSVTGTDVNGCIGTANVSVKVYTLPTVLANATASAICTGSSTTISASGANSYVWNPASGIVSPTSNTTYSVTGTDAYGCSNTAQTFVTVTTPSSPTSGGDKSISIKETVPTLTATGTNIRWYDANMTLLGTGSSYTPAIATTSESVNPYKVTNTENGCESTPITITLTVSSCKIVAPSLDKTTISKCQNGTFGSITATGTSIQWYDEKGTPIPTTGGVLTPTVAGDYYASQTDGCESPKAKATAIENTLPVVTVNTSHTGICIGNSTTIEALGASSYVWDNSIGSNASITLKPTTKKTYTVTGTDINGCSNTAQTTIDVYSLPTISISTNTNTICAGGFATITSNGGITYAWDNDLNNIVQNINPTTTTTYSVTGTDGHQCTNTASTKLRVLDNPTVTVTGNPTTICSGSTSMITASGAVSYIWNNSITSATNTVSPTASTIYSVTGTDGNGCKNTAAITVNVNALPSSVNAPAVTVCEGNSGVLTTTGATGTINWYSSKTTGSIGNTASITVTEAGTYQVTQTINGCESKKTDVTFTINKKPTSVTIANIAIVSGESIPTIPAGQTVNWYTSDKTLIATASSYTPTVSNTTIKAYTYYIDVTAGGCNSTMTSFIFEVKAKGCPSAPTVSTTPFCEGSSGLITATGTSIKWYDSETGSTVLGTSNSYSVSAAGTYYATQTEATSTCESQRAKIDVEIKAKTPVTIKAPATMQLNDASVVISVNPIGGTLSGNNNCLNGYIFTPNTIGNNTLTYNFTNSAGCTSSTSTTIVVTGDADLSALKLAITTASDEIQNVIANSLVGTKVGNYPQSAVDALNTAVSTAIAVRDDNSSTQAIVDNATTTLNNAITIFGNSIIKAGNKDLLIALITSAQNTVDISSYGTAIGDYPPSAKTVLLNAIKAANEVKDATVTQAEVDAARSTLQAAIDAFKAQKITEIVATGITFSSRTVSINIGESLTLSYEPIPANATVPELVWTSSNESAITIDQNGKIKAVGTGSSIIIVSFKNDATKFAKITINSTVDVAEIDANTPDVYPNITSDVIYIKKTETVKSIHVIATDSKKVKDITPKSDVVILDLSDLSSGTYYIVLEMKNGSIITKNIVKE